MLKKTTPRQDWSCQSSNLQPLGFRSQVLPNHVIRCEKMPTLRKRCACLYWSFPLWICKPSNLNIVNSINVIWISIYLSNSPQRTALLENMLYRGHRGAQGTKSIPMKWTHILKALTEPEGIERLCEPEETSGSEWNMYEKKTVMRVYI